ncbi:ABA4-like family protein [Micromonospora sp. BRA006-A]|nr:ABA4-like family protein [Micromonospora sp. BRA006-A]
MSTALFSLTFALAAPFWALMVLAPRWSWTGRIVGSPLIVVPVLLVYAALVLPALGTVLPVVTAPTLDGLRDLLGTADGAAAAWAHMIAFDLFVGRWIWQDPGTEGCRPCSPPRCCCSRSCSARSGWPSTSDCAPRGGGRRTRWLRPHRLPRLTRWAGSVGCSTRGTRSRGSCCWTSAASAIWSSARTAARPPPVRSGRWRSRRSCWRCCATAGP